MFSLKSLIACSVLCAMVGQQIALAVDPTGYALKNTDKNLIAQWAEQIKKNQDEHYASLSPDRKLKLLNRTEHRLQRQVARLSRITDQQFERRTASMINFLKFGSALIDDEDQTADVETAQKEAKLSSEEKAIIGEIPTPSASDRVSIADQYAQAHASRTQLIAEFTQGLEQVRLEKVQIQARIAHKVNRTIASMDPFMITVWVVLAWASAMLIVGVVLTILAVLAPLGIALVCSGFAMLAAEECLLDGYSLGGTNAAAPATGLVGAVRKTLK